MKAIYKLLLALIIVIGVVFLLQSLPVDQAYLSTLSLGKSITWVSVLPPLIAVVIAYATGRIIVSLFIAVFLGGLLAAEWNLISALQKTSIQYMWGSVDSEFHLLIVVFIVSLVGMVAVISRMGGTQGIIQILSKRANSPRGASIVTALMGLFIFFDDYANTILVGTSARPLTDKYKVSREKLAYLVDSTAAPVAGLAVLSTWIGYEVGLFQGVLTELGVGITGYEAFFQALPYRFYCVFALLFVFINVFLDRDYGPMLKAQRRSLNEGKLYSEDAEFKTSIAVEKTRMISGVTPRWQNAVFPMLVVIGVIWCGLYLSGASALKLEINLIHLFSFEVMRQCFSSADNLFVLAVSGVAGSLIAILLALFQRILSLKESLITWGSSFKVILAPLVILILAWSMQKVCEDLGTSYFLTAALKDLVSASFLPLVIFVLAGLIAFSTGTSWGTMAILIPTAIPLTYHMGGMELAFISMAAVLDGAIFGDHCSPMSDTTLMSSIASACDHMHHVKTQLPYALTCMFLALFLGYFLTAQGLSYVYSYILGVLSIVGVFFIFGRKVTT